MRAATDADRITAVPYEPSLPVYTAWDTGIGDTTAIWFAQFHGAQKRVIDYYEASGVGLDHYVGVLNEKPYIYGPHILPHDARVRELGTGKTRVETLTALGLRTSSSRTACRWTTASGRFAAFFRRRGLTQRSAQRG